MTEQVQPNDETGSTGTGSGQRVDPLTGTEGDAFPVTSPGSATPLDEDEPERVVPPSPLWAMKERRHEQLFHRFGHPDRIRECIGSGDGAVFVIDDGSRHCMIGRRVGTTRDGCTYSLVGRVPRATYEALASGAVDGSRAFLDATDLGLSGTVEDPGLSNVFDVAFYDRPEDVPDEYLPPSPFLEFAEDLPTSDR